MKVYQRITLAGLLGLGSPAAFGFAEFGRGELLLSTSARATYDSRVYGGANGEDDAIFTLEPRLLYRREAGQIKLDGVLGARVNRYLDMTELNSEDLVTSVTLTLPPESTAVASGSFRAGYDEHTDVNYDVNTRVREKTFLSSLDATLPTGLKTAVLLSGMFRHDERNRFSDQETRDGSVGFRYSDFLGGSALDLRYRRLELESSGGNVWGIPLDQQSDIYSVTFSRPLYHDVRGSLSYGYRKLHRSQAEVFGGDPDTSGSIYTFSIAGPFLPRTVFPKLESSASFGYQKAETPGVNDPGGSRFYGALHLGWNPRERTQIALDTRRARELSINDLTYETTSVMLSLRQNIGDFMLGTLSGGYEKRDYRGLERSDDVALLSASLNYRVTKYWSAEAAYRLRDANSNAPAADYARHVVVGTVTYTF